MSGENCSSKVSIIGGTYREICYWPNWNSVYGSGWRAVRVFRALHPDAVISYYSTGGEEIQKMMKVYAGSERLEPHIVPIHHLLVFTMTTHCHDLLYKEEIVIHLISWPMGNM